MKNTRGSERKEKRERKNPSSNQSYYSGLRETGGRFPLTRNLSLEEAEAAVRNPPAAEATFPFRTTASEGGRRLSGISTGGLKWKLAPTGTSRREEGPARAADTEDEGEPSATTRIPEHAGVSRPKRGTSTPEHDDELCKYACKMSNSPVYELLKSSLEKNICPGTDRHNRTLSLDLVIASLAKNTWKRYNSALALWKIFCKKRGSTGSVKRLPEPQSEISSFGVGKKEGWP